MTTHAQPMPHTADDAELEAARDRARTEQLLERIAADDLAEHRARTAVLSSPAGRVARAAW